MSSGVFRGKEPSNRIELSRLVQDLLNFGVLGSLQLWGGCRWVLVSGDIWGMVGCPHMHAHACMHMYTCVVVLTGYMPASPTIFTKLHHAVAMAAT